jgi:hypothetical protein
MSISKVSQLHWGLSAGDEAEWASSGRLIGYELLEKVQNWSLALGSRRSQELFIFQTIKCALLRKIQPGHLESRWRHPSFHHSV